MRHADALSRNPIPDGEVSVINVNVINITEGDWLLAAQEADKNIKSIKEILSSGEIHKNRDIFEQYELKGGKVYKKKHHMVHDG